MIQSLLERYRTAHSEVIHVVADAPEVSPIFTAGTELAEILDELKPLDNETVGADHCPSLFTLEQLPCWHYQY